MSGEIVVVGTVSDDPLASDVAYFMGQKTDISDEIALKNFANSEFCLVLFAGRLMTHIA